MFGMIKRAKQQAAAEAAAAKLQADAVTQAATVQHEAAVQQATATDTAARLSAEAADRQTQAIAMQTKAYQEAASNQARLMAKQGEDQKTMYLNQTALIEKQGKAQSRAAAQAAQAQRDAVIMGQHNREAQIAQQVELSKASDGMKAPPKPVEVTLADDVQAKSDIDPATGRRRPVRQSFFSKSNAASGIVL